MGATNLSVKKGKCINFGNCKIADTKEIIEVNLGDDFVCSNPDCRGMLVEVKREPKKKWILYSAIAVVLVGIIGFSAIKSKIDRVTDISNAVEKGITIIDEQLKNETDAKQDNTQEAEQTPPTVEKEGKKQTDEKKPHLGLDPTIRYSGSKEIVTSSGEHYIVNEGDFFIGVVDKNNNPENGKIYDKGGHQKFIILPKSNQ